jgi:hypothetical protein
VRIAIVDTLYPAFVAAHYAKRPELAHEPYAVQHAALIDRSFGTSDAYSTNLRAVGHDAVDLLAGVEPLDRAWREEHESPVRRAGRRARRLLARGPDPAPDPRAVVCAQIRAFGADVVYCQDLSALEPGDLAALRGEGRLVVGQIASPLPDDPGRLHAYDLLISSFPHYVERFRAMGIDAEYLRIAFDERVLERVRAEGVDPSPAAPGRSGTVFVGGVNPHVHAGGVALLERVLGAGADLSVYGYGADQLEPGSSVREAWRGEAWGLEMYAILARAAIALNRHIGVAEGVANNMRLYEATGMGALLVTEAAPNLADLFVPGEEVVAYRDVDDLIDLLRRLSADDGRRREIAERGQRRTLREHTYARRMAELAELLGARVR